MNLLLIDSRLDDVQSIVNSLSKTCNSVVFSYETDSYDSLKEKIVALDKEFTHNYNCVGIAQLNYGAPVFDFLQNRTSNVINLVKNVEMEDESLTTWNEFSDVCKWLVEEKSCAFIDLLACNIWADPDWVYIINSLRERGIYIRASVDITGEGGNFILESDGIDTIGIYFTNDILAYKHSFDFHPYFQTWSSGNEELISANGGGTYNYAGYSTFTGTYSGNAYTGSDITTNISGLKNHHVIGTGASQTVIYHKLDGTIITGGAYVCGGNASRDPVLSPKLVNIKKVVPYGGGFFALKNDGTGILVWGADIATPNASFLEITAYNLADVIGNGTGILGITDASLAINITPGFSVPIINPGFNEYLPGTYFNNDETVLFTQLNQELFAWKTAVPAYYQIALYYNATSSSLLTTALPAGNTCSLQMPVTNYKTITSIYQDVYLLPGMYTLSYWAIGQGGRTGQSDFYVSTHGIYGILDGISSNITSNLSTLAWTFITNTFTVTAEGMKRLYINTVNDSPVYSPAYSAIFVTGIQLQASVPPYVSSKKVIKYATGQTYFSIITEDNDAISFNNLTGYSRPAQSLKTVNAICYQYDNTISKVGTRSYHFVRVLNKYSVNVQYTSDARINAIPLNPFMLSQSGFSFSFWMLSDISSGITNYALTPVFDFGHTILNKSNIDFTYVNGAYIGIYNDSLMNYGVQLSNVSLNDNQWHHVVVSINPDLTCKYYLDGNAPVVSYIQQYPSSTERVANYIGRTLRGAQDYEGNLDDFRFYNGKILTDEEAYSLFLYDGTNSSTYQLNNDPALLFYKNAEEEDYPAPIDTTDSKLPGGSFLSLNNYIQLPNLTFAKTGFTISSWAKVESSFSLSTTIYLHFHFDINSNLGGGQIYSKLNTTTNTLDLVIGNVVVLSAPNINYVGNWVHTAYVFNTNNTVELYINGALVKAQGSIAYPSYANGFNYNFIGNFYSFWNAIVRPSAVAVKYNDFRIYNGKSLSAQEIQDLYNYDGTNFDSFYLNNSPELFMHLPLNSAYDYNKNVAKSLMSSTIEDIYPTHNNISNTVIKRSNGLLCNILGKSGYDFISPSVKIKKCIPYSTSATPTNNLAFLFSDGSGLLVGSTIIKGMVDFVSNIYSYAYIQNGSVVIGGTTTYVTGTYAVPAGYSVTDGNVVKLWTTNHTSYVALKTDRTVVAWGYDLIYAFTPAPWKFASIASELTACVNVQNTGAQGFNLVQNDTIYSLGYFDTATSKLMQSVSKTPNKNVDIQCMRILSLVDYDASFTISPSTMTYGISTTVSYWSNNQNLMAEPYRTYGLYANSKLLSTFNPTTNTFTYTFQNVVLNGDYVSSLSICDITSVKYKIISFKPNILQPPSEPIVTNVVPANNQLTVHFNQPATGGSPITTYKYFIGSAETELTPEEIQLGLIDAFQTTSPITITGLTNGQKYKLFLYAANSYGNSGSRVFLLNGDFSYIPSMTTIIPYTFWNYSVAGTTTNSISIVNGASNGIVPPESYQNQMVLTHNQTGAGNGTLSITQNVAFENYGLKRLHFWLATQPFPDSNGAYAQVQYNGTTIGTIQLANADTGKINATSQQNGAISTPYTKYTMYFDTKKMQGTASFTNSIKNIPGLRLWLDAQDYSSLNLTGLSLNSWTDTSPYGAIATKFGTYATNAQYSSTALNGLPGIQFTNVVNSSNGLSIPIQNNAFFGGMSIFVVFSRNENAGTYETLVNRTNNNIARPVDMWGVNRYIGNGTTFSTYTSKFNLNNKNTIGIYSCTMTPTTINEYFNGVNTLSTTLTNYNDAGSTSFYIATRADKMSGLNGAIGQVIVYDRQLNNSQRQTIEAYLMNRWDLNNQMVDSLPYSQSLPTNPERYIGELKFNLFNSRIGYTNTSSTSKVFLTGISLTDEGYDHVVPQTTNVQPTINTIVPSNQSALISYSLQNSGFYSNKFQYSTDGINYTDINYVDNSYNGITFYNGATITNTDPTINVNHWAGTSALRIYDKTNSGNAQYATLPSFSLAGSNGFSTSFWLECSCNLPTPIISSAILNPTFSLDYIPESSYKTSSLISNWTYTSDASSYLYLVNGTTTITNNIALPATQCIGLATYVSQSLSQTVYLTAGAYTFSVSVLGRASFYNVLHSLQLRVGANVSNAFANFSTAAFTTYQFSFMILTDGNYNLSLLFNNPTNTFSLLFVTNLALTYVPQTDMIPILSLNASSTYSQTQACIQLYLYSGYLYSCISDGVTPQTKLIYLNPINDLTWYHIAFTVDSNGTQMTYINGVLQTAYDNILFSQTAYTANYVGRSINSTSNFNGFIDDIRIYKKALTASEAAYLYMYNNQTTFSLNAGLSLIMRYKFDQFFDSSINPIAKIPNLINGTAYNNFRIRSVVGGLNAVNVVNPNFASPFVAASSFLSGAPPGWTLNTSSSVTPSIYGANYNNEYQLVGFPSQYLTWQFATAGQYMSLYQYCWFDVGTYDVSYYIGGNSNYNVAHTVTLLVDGNGVGGILTSPNSWKKIKYTTQITMAGLKIVHVYASTTATATQIMSLTGISITKQTYSLDSSITSVTPLGECIVPTIIGTPFNNSIILTFTQEQTPGATITGYKYSLNAGALIDAFETTSPIIIGGLTNGTAYTVQLFVVNNLGYVSNGSNQVTITPYKSLSSLSLAVSQIDISTNSAIISTIPNQNISGLQNIRYIYSIDGNNTYTSSPMENYTLNGNLSTISYDSSDKVVGNSSINLQGGYVSIPKFKSAQTGISISFWMKMTSLYQPTTYSKVFDFGNTAQGANAGFGNMSFFCKLNSTANSYTNNAFALRLCTSAGILYTINYTKNATLDAWMHVAIIYEPSGIITTYINGVSLGTQYLPYPESITRTYNYIGASTSVGESYNYYGKIDDFRIYNGKILNANDINLIYGLQSAALDTDQTLIRYTFDQQQTSVFSVLPLSSGQSTYNFISKMVIDLNITIPLINPNFDLSAGTINTLNQITTLTEIPGWTINPGSTYDALYISNNSVTVGVSLNTNLMPYKYYLALSRATAGGAGTGSIYQNAYLNSGTYQFALFLAITQTATGTVNLYIDNVLVTSSSFTGAGGTYYKISPGTFEILTSGFRQVKIEVVTSTSSVGCLVLVSGIQLILLRNATSRNVQKIMDYQFETSEQSGIYLKNNVTGGYDASLNGASLTSSYSKYGTSCLNPSGTTSFLLPSFTLMQPYQGDGITISFWIYMTTVGAASILTMSQLLAPTCAINLTYSSGFILAITNSASITTTGTTATTVSANAWNHVVITIKYVSTMANAVMTFYLNGVQKYQNAAFNYPELITRNTNKINYAANPGYYVDSFKFYKECLTGDEVRDTYYTNSSAFESITAQTKYIISPLVPNAPILTNLVAGNGELYATVIDGSSVNAPVTGHKYSVNGGQLIEATYFANQILIQNIPTNIPQNIQVFSYNQYGISPASNVLTKSAYGIDVSISCIPYVSNTTDVSFSEISPAGYNYNYQYFLSGGLITDLSSIVNDYTTYDGKYYLSTNCIYDMINVKIGSSSLNIANNNVWSHVKFEPINFSANGFSIAFWFKSTTPSASTVANLFLAQEPYYRSYFSINLNGTNGVITFISNTGQSFTTGATNYNTNAWFHLVFTLTANGVGTFYINGISVATYTFTIKLPYGNMPVVFVGSNGYKGNMDDLRIYNGKTLTSTEALNLSQYTGQPGFALDTDATLKRYTFDISLNEHITRTNGSYALLNGVYCDTANIVYGNSSFCFSPTSDTYTAPAIRVNYNTIETLNKNFTFAIWIKANLLPAYTSSRIFDMYSTISDNNCVRLYISSNTLRFQIGANAAAGQTYNTGYNINTNVWTHVVGTFASGVFTLYINTVNTYSATFTGVDFFANIYDRAVILGNSFYQNKTDCFNGNLDDFRFYNGRVLTTSEISAIYSYSGNGSTYLNTDPTLVHWIKSNNTIVNTNPSYLNTDYIPVAGAYISTQDKAFGNACMAIPLGGYVKLPRLTLGSTGLTISCWFKLNLNCGANAKLFSLSSIIQASTELECIVYSTGTGGNNGVGMAINGSAIIDNGMYNATVLTGKWFHIAITIDVWGNIYFYMNGALSKTTTLQYPTVLNKICNYLGYNNATGTATFSGFIDDFRIYNRVLAQQEITMMYNYRGESGFALDTDEFLNYRLKFDTSNATNLAKKYQIVNSTRPLYHNGLVLSKNAVVGTTSIYMAQTGSSGYSPHIELPPLYLNPAGFTYAGWVKAYYNVNYLTIFDAGLTGTMRNNLIIYLTSAASTNMSIVSNGVTYTTNYNIANNVWTHIGIVLDSASAKLFIYVNGALRQVFTNVSYTAGYCSKAYIGRSTAMNASTLEMNVSYNGFMDDTRFYNGKPLSATEIYSLYNYRNDANFSLDNDLTLFYRSNYEQYNLPTQAVTRFVDLTIGTKYTYNLNAISTENNILQNEGFDVNSLVSGSTQTITSTTQNVLSSWTITPQFYARTVVFYTANNSNVTVQPPSPYNHYFVYDNNTYLTRDISALSFNKTSPWGTPSIPTLNNGIGVSQDGKRAVFCSNGGYIYFSTYDGTSWSTLAQTLDNASRLYQGIALNADGTRGVAIVNGGGAYYFTWNGTNYSTLTLTADANNRSYTGLAMTTDGSRIFASVGNDYIYYANWNATTNNYNAFVQTGEISLRNYASIACSTDGSRIVYNVSGGYTYWSDWNGATYIPGIQFVGASTYTYGVLIMSGDKKYVIAGTSSTSAYYSVWNGTNYVEYTVIPSTVTSGLSKMWGGCYNNATNSFYITSYDANVFYNIAISTTINNSIYQNVYLTPGTYTLSFYSNQRSGYSGSVSVYGSVGTQTSNFIMPQVYYWTNTTFSATIDLSGIYPIAIGFANNSAARSITYITGVSITKQNFASRTADFISYTNPDAPVITSIVPGNSQLTVNITQGATGGFPIEKYAYSLDSGSTFQDFSGLNPLVIRGLTNGTTYQVLIKANNGRLESTFSNQMSGKPFTNPDAPIITSIVPGNSQLIVNITQGATGGLSIQKYSYSLDSGTTFVDFAELSSLVITGLTNGTTYQVLIKGNNGMLDSSNSNQITETPFTNPDAPVITSITPENRQLIINITQGTTGGFPIEKYMYSLDNGSTFQDFSGLSPLLITGLTNGQTYQVLIKGYNGKLESSFSNKMSGKPYTNPDAPTITSIVSALGGILYVHYTLGSDYGSPLTMMSFTITNGATYYAVPIKTSPLRITGLIVGQQYNIMLKAHNINGVSSASNMMIGMPASIPGAPTVFSVTNGMNMSTVTISPGAANGTPILGYQASRDNGMTYVDVSYNSSNSTIVFNGLTNGETSEVYIRAVNSLGVSLKVSAFLRPVDTRQPSSPTITSVSLTEEGLATISYTLADDSPITKYVINAISDYGTSAFNITQINPVKIYNLYKGISYRFSVSIENKYGIATSADSSSVIIATKPNSIFIREIIPNYDINDTLVYITYPQDGGSPITKYQYSINSGEYKDISGLISPFHIHDLSENVSLLLKIKAINLYGEAESLAKPFTIFTREPQQISIIQTTMVYKQMKIKFMPISNNGATITSYSYLLYKNDVPALSYVEVPPVLPITIEGLELNAEYSVQLVATNRIGSSIPSNKTQSKKYIKYAPSTPIIYQLLQGFEQVSVYTILSEPTEVDISSYFYSIDGGEFIQTADNSNPFTITGLSNNQQHTIQVKAANEVGVSSASKSYIFTIFYGVPRQPSLYSYYIRLIDGFTFTFKSGYDNGSPIIGYKYRLNGGDWTNATIMNNSITVSGLVQGVYKCELLATNALGDGAISYPKIYQTL